MKRRSFSYKDRDNARSEWCEGCGGRFKEEELAPHHVKVRRYGDECIWLCHKCHSKVHLKPKWAYENNLLESHKADKVNKKPTTKTCTHKAKYYNKELDAWICQFCKKEVKP